MENNVQITNKNRNMKILKSEIFELISLIKKFDYVHFYYLFWPKLKNEKTEDFQWLINALNDEVSLNQNYKLLVENRISLENFYYLLLNYDSNTLRNIQNNILKPTDDKIYNVVAFMDIINLNNNYLQISYKTVMHFEFFFKKVLAVELIKIERPFKNSSNFAFEQIKEQNKIKEFRPEQNPKKSALIFNKMSFDELIKYFSGIENTKLLENVIMSLLGDIKYYDKIKKQRKELLEVKSELITHLRKIKDLRNEIMHFGFILPFKDNILMDAMKSLVEISQVMSNGSTTNFYLQSSTELFELTSKYLNKANDDQVFQYFQEKILSYKLY